MALKRPVWILDTGRMRKHFANEAALHLWGIEPGQEAEFFARDFTPHSDAMRQRLGRLVERISAGEIVAERWTFYPKHRPFTVDALMSGVRLDNGNVGLLMEVEHYARLTDELRAGEALRHTLVNVLLFDEEGWVSYRNPAAEACFPGERRSFASMFADPSEGLQMWGAVVARDAERPDAFMGRTVSGDFIVDTVRGRRWHGIDARTTIDPVTGRLSVLVNQRDVTDRVEATSRAEFYAGYDTVTGLANRRRFAEQLERAMADPASVGGLLAIDLNGFKEINDSYGHAVGDTVLREIGRRLSDCVGPHYVCARLGGDEFAVILPGLRTPEALTDRADLVRRSLASVVEEPSMATRLTVSASFGAALWPRDGDRPDVLQRNADLALYAAKAEEGRRVHLFDPAMRRAADERYKCIDDLRASLAVGGFEVHYQPLVRMVDRRPFGFEALLRWRHPVRGLLLPGEFLEEAESIGLMVPIGDVVVRQVCRQIGLWRQAGIDPGRIAINLSRNNFQRGASLAGVGEAILATGVEAAQIEFEVSETVTFGARGEAVVDALMELRRQGFAIALDDFGIGHASLTHLRRLPVDTIKLDRSFIVDMANSVADRALVRAVAGLGRDLGMRVLAEGIETEEQAAAVQELGCECGQGYLFGHPMEAGVATGWLERLARSDV
ncbi:EAL domain-containing protein [Ancylobacter sp. Lp-2]|uniref:putative bifunctional diguanylate cyclase/phosphodiesterase n=1 Tax=Ancylobacter sp. Lp-2 TaxID=2881339 RepID=UPI001E33A09C|nr:EAL domain-containing protein [Ancylobacter sp. Lp-2]